MTLLRPKQTPSRHILNPILYEAARRRWPGSRITDASLFDVSVLDGIAHHVPADPAAAALLGKELATERKRHAQEGATAAAYRRIGFDPSRDYRNPISTKE